MTDDESVRQARIGLILGWLRNGAWPVSAETAATAADDIAAALAGRDAENAKLREALNQIAVLVEWQTSGPSTIPRCKSDALSASQATSLRGSISEIARTALAAPKDSA